MIKQVIIKDAKGDQAVVRQLNSRLTAIRRKARSGEIEQSLYLLCFQLAQYRDKRIYNVDIISPIRLRQAHRLLYD